MNRASSSSKATMISGKMRPNTAYPLAHQNMGTRRTCTRPNGKFFFLRHTVACFHLDVIRTLSSERRDRSLEQKRKPKSLFSTTTIFVL
ncbi:hypothetical protein QR680_014702 [Steinernema hermaphroditum]|uniref:Uncharacterized protein n=1 Tax=Steinernema hermaphroditum TaxID=289476 RepID=A0AA39I9U6_9BILA|nr:hypothetical protein QR680_014702 [Steinernema hermaphroditum]